MTTGLHIINEKTFDEKTQFKNDVLLGLSQPSKEISSKYFYDKVGSELYLELTKNPDNLLITAEAEILEANKNILSFYFEPEPFNLIEFSPGESINSTILINQFLQDSLYFNYIPIDISKNYLELIIQQNKKQFANIELKAINADYYKGLNWVIQSMRQRNVLLFLSSHVSFMPTIHIEPFLKQIRRILNDGDYFLISFDLRKNIDKLLQFYNDPKSLYPTFVMHILERINHELGGHFELNKFKFKAVYNKDLESIEKFLISTENQIVNIDSMKQSFSFEKDELIHVGSSYKYREQQVVTLAEEDGLEISRIFKNSQDSFMNVLFKVNK